LPIERLEKPGFQGYYSFMRSASISEAKNKLSALLDRVRAGETILILDRGIPVAQLVPANEVSDDARMARLERAGVIRPPKRRGHAPSRLAQPPPGPAGGTGALEGLLQERRESR
jgi:prevent-host-death family protein